MEDQGNVSPSSSSSSSYSSSSSASPNLQPLSIDEELWLMAEERAQEILYIIQPNVVSERSRKEVTDYVKNLIRVCYGSEVFQFGSVPLKTYLPDGDIDLTTLCLENEEEDLAQLVCNVLGNGVNSEYEVKDIQYIRAQVPVVKCTVKNIAVDISFNQIAGLCTLCFLEQVDELVGKNHLFKRSIILIKAWCYYESRILGAHHGLISTYAVETLVLYIMNLFHASVQGPLEVLYRFLDYYSTFDWDTYCLSINGPVAISSLPEIVETPDCDWDELLLSQEFLRNCRDTFSAPARVPETLAQEFPVKHLNILDPLKSNNNLGRSVSRGNFHRIRFALSFGARKLREILTLPGERMGAALEKFFMNTMDRNGKGQRPDILVPVPAFGTGRFEKSALSGDFDSYYGGLQYSQLYHNYSIAFGHHQMFPSSPSQVDVNALSAQQNWSMFYQMGTDLYVPFQTLYLPNASPQFETTYNIEEKGRSRGTGTYIPDMALLSHRDAHTRVTRPRESSAPVNCHVPQKLHPKEELPEIPPETDINGDSRHFKMTKEEFPLLSSSQKTSPRSETEGSLQLTPESEQIISSSLSNLNIEFGTYKPTQPLTTPPLLPAKNLKPASGVSTTLGSLLGVPTMEKETKEKFPVEKMN